MKLQLALDGTLTESIDIFNQVHSYVDIVELGTPLIYREGVSIVRIFRELASKMPIVADLKIMDAGEAEATIAFEAGCNFVTILGVTHDATVKGAVKAAERFGGRIIADMLQVDASLTRTSTLLSLGCDYICIHTAFDLQADQTPLQALQTIRNAFPDAPLAVAGGVNLETIDAILPLHPDIVIVGSAITKSPDPAYTAYELHKRVQSA